MLKTGFLAWFGVPVTGIPKKRGQNAKKVEIGQIRSSRYKNFETHPLDDEKVKHYVAKFKVEEFWPGYITARPLGENEYEAAFGDHRLAALRQLHPDGKFEIVMEVKDMSEAEFIGRGRDENNDETVITIQHTVHFIEQTVKAYGEGILTLKDIPAPPKAMHNEEILRCAPSYVRGFVPPDAKLKRFYTVDAMARFGNSMDLRSAGHASDKYRAIFSALEYVELGLLKKHSFYSIKTVTEMEEAVATLDREQKQKEVEDKLEAAKTPEQREQDRLDLEREKRRDAIPGEIKAVGKEYKKAKSQHDKLVEKLSEVTHDHDDLSAKAEATKKESDRKKAYLAKYKMEALEKDVNVTAQLAVELKHKEDALHGELMDLMHGAESDTERAERLAEEEAEDSDTTLADDEKLTLRARRKIRQSWKILSKELHRKHKDDPRQMLVVLEADKLINQAFPEPEDAKGATA